MSELTEWLAEALEVCEGATEGPWDADTYMTKPRRVIDLQRGGWRTQKPEYMGSVSIIPSDGVYGEFDGHDAEFIAHARTGYPAALRALQAVLSYLNEMERLGDAATSLLAFDIRRAVEEAVSDE